MPDYDGTKDTYVRLGKAMGGQDTGTGGALENSYQAPDGWFEYTDGAAVRRLPFVAAPDASGLESRTSIIVFTAFITNCCDLAAAISLI